MADDGRSRSGAMIVDIHCHVGFSARLPGEEAGRFSFEAMGSASGAGMDSYFSSRLVRRPLWRAFGWLLRRVVGFRGRFEPGPELDAAIERFNTRHFDGAAGVDRLVLLALDEYHDDEGRPVGAAERGGRAGSDLYVSNSLVRAMCTSRPERFAFGASIHPYRANGRADACDMLAEVAEAGAVLVKWLPAHQNIRAEDPRTIEFLRAAARLGIAVLIHYGNEMTLAAQHREFEDPAPMLAVLRGLREKGEMPTVIVAHMATSSTWIFGARHHRTLAGALLGEFADAPLYADISALAALGRGMYLMPMARRKALHFKLLWGTDFPIPPLVRFYRRHLSGDACRQIVEAESWIERDLRLKRAVGFDEGVFMRAADVLGISHKRDHLE